MPTEDRVVHLQLSAALAAHLLWHLNLQTRGDGKGYEWGVVDVES